MSLFTPPSTPETTLTGQPAIRRSFTAPVRSTHSPRTPPTTSSAAAGTVETLYTHVDTKVVSFNTPSTDSRPSSSSSWAAKENNKQLSDALPWTAPTERTVASGPLRVYRVPSTGVSFLNSGQFLRPILPKTQCWCVDEGSRFVLRARESAYYRIELPSGGEEDGSKIEEFKTVLHQILQYEKTPCPFRRGFFVQEEPTTHVRRLSRTPTNKAKRWTLNRVWTPEDADHPVVRVDSPLSANASSSPDTNTGSTNVETTGPSDHGLSESVDGTKEEAKHPKPVEATATPTSTPSSEPSQLDSGSPRALRTPPRLARILLSNRSVTAPPHLTVLASPPSSTTVALIEEHEPKDLDTASFISSSDSFCSCDDADITESQDHLRVFNHRQGKFDTAITPEDPNTPTQPAARPMSVLSEDDRPPSASNLSTPTLISDSDDMGDLPWSDAVTPPSRSGLRLRRFSGTSRRRGLSPMPHPANLFSPISNKAPASPMSNALIRKAYALLVGPPAHLIALMVRIATKIVRCTSSIYPEDDVRTPRKIPGTWESSSEDDDWDEDDYGIPLGNVTSTNVGEEREQRSAAWGVD